MHADYKGTERGICEKWPSEKATEGRKTTTVNGDIIPSDMSVLPSV